MFALDFATQAQEMKAIGGQADYALGSVHAVTGDGTRACCDYRVGPGREDRQASDTALPLVTWSR